MSSIEQTVVIHKFPLRDLHNTIAVRADAVLLSVQDQNGMPTAWVMHSYLPGSHAIRRMTIALRLTGDPFDFDPATQRFVSTVQMRDGIVLHAFELL